MLYRMDRYMIHHIVCVVTSHVEPKMYTGDILYILRRMTNWFSREKDDISTEYPYQNSCFRMFGSVQAVLTRNFLPVTSPPNYFIIMWGSRKSFWNKPDMRGFAGQLLSWNTFVGYNETQRLQHGLLETSYIMFMCIWMNLYLKLLIFNIRYKYQYPLSKPIVWIDFSRSASEQR